MKTMSQPTHEMPPVATPCCGHLVDSATEVPSTQRRGGKRPKAGDLSICINCGEWLVYVDNHNLRLCLPRDLERLDDELLTQLQGAKEFIRERGKIG
jgi:hypothetical protein